MKNIFNHVHTSEILTRINQLQADSQPIWGRMSVAQMLAHCSAFQEVAIGNSTSSRSWLGILIGKFVKSIFYNDNPLPKNMSTIPTIMIVDSRDFEKEKEILKQNIITLQSSGPENITVHPHPFFGKLTSEEWGKGIYKHLDHHLKQFGV